MTKFIIGESNVDEVAGALLNIIENEPTAEFNDERSTPKKPKNISSCGEKLFGDCPICQSMVIKNEDIAQRYCSCCGQAIDWRD